jgi:hypothetical protein
MEDRPKNGSHPRPRQPSADSDLTMPKPKLLQYEIQGDDEKSDSDALPNYNVSESRKSSRRGNESTIQNQYNAATGAKSGISNRGRDLLRKTQTTTPLTNFSSQNFTSVAVGNKEGNDLEESSSPVDAGAFQAAIGFGMDMNFLGDTSPPLSPMIPTSASSDNTHGQYTCPHQEVSDFKDQGQSSPINDNTAQLTDARDVKSISEAASSILPKSKNEGEANKNDEPLFIESSSKGYRKSNLQPNVEYYAEPDAENGCKQVHPDQERNAQRKEEGNSDELAMMPLREPANKRKRGTPTRAMAQQRAQEPPARGGVYPPTMRGRASDMVSQKPAGLGSEEWNLGSDVAQSLGRSSSHRTGPSRFDDAFQYFPLQNSPQPYPVVQDSSQHERTPTNSWTSHVGKPQTLTTMGFLPTPLSRPQPAPSHMPWNGASPSAASMQAADRESFEVEMMDEAMWNFYNQTTTAEAQPSPHAAPSVDQNMLFTTQGTFTDQGMLVERLYLHSTDRSSHTSCVSRDNDGTRPPVSTSVNIPNDTSNWWQNLRRNTWSASSQLWRLPSRLQSRHLDSAVHGS